MSKHSVLWTSDHISSIICHYLPGFFNGSLHTLSIHEGWPGWVGLGGWLNTKRVRIRFELANVTHPILSGITHTINSLADISSSGRSDKFSRTRLPIRECETCRRPVRVSVLQLKRWRRVSWRSRSLFRVLDYDPRCCTQNTTILRPRETQTFALPLFCDSNLEINPMTLKLEGDLDSLKMHLHTENGSH